MGREGVHRWFQGGRHHFRVDRGDNDIILEIWRRRLYLIPSDLGLLDRCLVERIFVRAHEITTHQRT
jgi:hypothetical protein